MAETCDKAIASKYHRKFIILSYNIRNIEISNQNNLKLISSSFIIVQGIGKKIFTICSKTETKYGAGTNG